MNFSVFFFFFENISPNWAVIRYIAFFQLTIFFKLRLERSVILWYRLSELILGDFFFFFSFLVFFNSGIGQFKLVFRIMYTVGFYQLFLFSTNISNSFTVSLAYRR